MLVSKSVNKSVNMSASQSISQLPDQAGTQSAHQKVSQPIAQHLGGLCFHNIVNIVVFGKKYFQNIVLKLKLYLRWH